jgi:hypothetical protein
VIGGTAHERVSKALDRAAEWVAALANQNVAEAIHAGS